MFPLVLLGQSFSNESVLNSGTWYKIGVTQEGMYRMDRSFLSNLGISGSIDPRDIRLFAGQSGLLPQLNSESRVDDLREIPIFVAGEGDGQMGADDFVLFFGEGSSSWNFNSQRGQYQHAIHHYADTNFYFITIDKGRGLRIADAPALTATYTPAASRGVRFTENELDNPIHSGRLWLGETFDLVTERKFSFFVPGADRGGNVRIALRLAAQSSSLSSFQIRVGSQLAGTVSMLSTDVVNPDSRYYQSSEASYVLPATLIDADDSLRITLTYNKGAYARAKGWLDYISLDFDQSFSLNQAGQRTFRILDGTAPGAVAGLAFAASASDYQVWDVTSPFDAVRLPLTANGSTLNTTVAAATPRRIIAHRGGYLTPANRGRVRNQNLHGMDPVDYLIITHPDFKPAADSLAAFHQEVYQRSTAIVYPQDIYNEFSGGKQDVSAIRDFIRMLYVRSLETSPGFVCMLGDGTYDFKGIVPTSRGNNFVPTYQSRDSWDPTDSYTSDDFFVLLSDNEGLWGENSGVPGDRTVELNTLDATIGRLPVQTVEEGLAMVRKIRRYATDKQSFGAWKNRVILVGDYKDSEGSLHIGQADSYTNRILASNPCMNIDKIYLDNYPVERTAGRTLFPEAKAALLQAMDEGSFIINYTGHGGTEAWSNSYILESPDIARINNDNRMPAIITATCEFGRFDLADSRSGAEELVMRTDGGAIAMFTTVRLVFSSPNKTLNDNLYNHMFTYDPNLGRRLTVGEIMQRTKNQTFPLSPTTNLNSRNFTLLGDPGLILAYPELTAMVTHLNGEPIQGGGLDTLRSLSKVNLRGMIVDDAGNPHPEFNGAMEATLFDKPAKFTTLLSNFVFFWQKNRLFNGEVTVANGEFEVNFVVPIDVSYEQGFGKFGAYFSSTETDGAGCLSQFSIGGTDENGAQDDDGPQVNLFMNDEFWKDGGMTGPSPDLFAQVFDESGINTTGNGIGHEITAVLDGDEGNVLILNNYYRAAKDSYRSGTVRYPLKDLSVGKHTLRIRVWDVANNPSEDETEFYVVDDARMALEQVLNFPNPFTESTTFLINHNQDGKDLEVEVAIFTVSGQQVATLSGTYTEAASMASGLTWDGTASNGQPVSSGIYVYRVTVKEKDTERTVTASNKLVVIR
jgi:hypothetical protein